jgi:hypothetical protein
MLTPSSRPLFNVPCPSRLPAALAVQLMLCMLHLPVAVCPRAAAVLPGCSRQQHQQPPPLNRWQQLWWRLQRRPRRRSGGGPPPFHRRLQQAGPGGSGHGGAAEAGRRQRQRHGSGWRCAGPATDRGAAAAAPVSLELELRGITTLAGSRPDMQGPHSKSIQQQVIGSRDSGVAIGVQRSKRQSDGAAGKFGLHKGNAETSGMGIGGAQ